MWTTALLVASASPSHIRLFDGPSRSITCARGVRLAKRWARPRLRARRCADEQWRWGPGAKQQGRAERQQGWLGQERPLKESGKACVGAKRG
eukprot:1569713-Alexandrium_andersonii.AAC.1